MIKEGIKRVVRLFKSKEMISIYQSIGGQCLLEKSSTVAAKNS